MASRMTKFLRQNATLRLMERDVDGEAILDIYGNARFKEPVVVKCRRERSLKDVLTTTGAITRSVTTYYIDPQYIVSLGDLIDGKPIIDFEEYINEHGLCEGYRVMV